MSVRTHERWLEAGAWLETARGVPAIVAQEVRKRAAKATKRAIPAKPRIRIPKGVKTPQKEKKALHGECEALCKALVFHRDCGDWRSREGNCITCGNWRSLQWGHFIPRQHAPALRYSVVATGGQCAYCNGPGQGEAIKFAEAIDKRDGLITSGELIQKYKGVRHTWNKTNLAKQLDALVKRCQAVGIDVAAVLAEWKGPKSDGAQRPASPRAGTINTQVTTPGPQA